MVTQQLSDTDINKNILNIGKRRIRAIYVRPDGKPTAPLPADPQSRMYYQGKGFKLQSELIPQSGGGVTCPLCQATMQSALGLRSHLRVHINTVNKEETQEVKE